MTALITRLAPLWLLFEKVVLGHEGTVNTEQVPTTSY